MTNAASNRVRDITIRLADASNAEPSNTPGDTVSADGAFRPNARRAELPAVSEYPLRTSPCRIDRSSSNVGHAERGQPRHRRIGIQAGCLALHRASHGQDGDRRQIAERVAQVSEPPSRRQLRNARRAVPRVSVSCLDFSPADPSRAASKS